VADDRSDSSAGPSRNMVEIARALGEQLPPHDGVGYIVIAVDIETGQIGWVSQVSAEQVTEVLGNIVVSRRN